MRIARAAGVIAAAVLVVSGLSACQSKVGAAAFVGSTKITESTVGKYVVRDVVATVDDSTGLVQSPKSLVLTTLVRSAIYDQVLAAAPGGSPTAAELDSAGQAFMKSQGITGLAQLEDAAGSVGYTKAFASLYVAEAAKQTIAETVLKDPGDDSALLAAVAKLKLKVSISPRYGNWTDASLSVGAGPSVPAFLTVKSPNSTAILNPTG